jgi:membrane protein DedA with SNARE-associated domain
MNTLLHRLLRHGISLVFANVFLEQIGVPIPALPTLIVSGALVARGRLQLLPLLGAALLASVLADTVWFLGGRWKGHKVLRVLCRISLSPDSCVRQTESLYERRGALSLLFAKFIPGYNTVAPPLAGTMGTSLPAFLLWDSLGSLLWIGAGVAVGWLFHSAVGRALDYLDTLGFWALIVLAVGLALVIAVKYFQRRRLLRLLELARISVYELRDMIDRGEAPVIVDVRTQSRFQVGRIPGALRMTLEELDEKLADLPRERDIVLYCT